jgi:hypothetical protein
VATLSLNVRDHIEAITPIVADKNMRQIYLMTRGLSEPKAKTEQGLQLRLLCPKWWRRSLERVDGRNKEAELIDGGRVSSRREKYSSNLAVHRVGKKAHENKKFMDTQAMLSDTEDLVEMNQIIEHSLANPTNRRAELMIRMAGFESYASMHGFVGEFYTMTCPSKFHRYSGKALNENYDNELTPKDAQNYLVHQWAKIRAEWARHNIKPFGFRVAEPHHDGCPHWHLLLFVKPFQRRRVRRVMAHYALEIDGQEQGADKHRFKYVQIDPDQGTATGYIAKYISKNLGFSIESPTEDTDDKSLDYGRRVKAWASTWGIRQFQQIGGAPVSVWRELRKITEEHPDETIEQARCAADESRWADFLEIMGGADAKRIEQSIALVKKNMIDRASGELKANQYGELITAIYGIASLAAQAITKTKNWIMTSSKDASLRRAKGGVARAAGGVAFTSWSPVNNCTA